MFSRLLGSPRAKASNVVLRREQDKPKVARHLPEYNILQYEPEHDQHDHVRCLSTPKYMYSLLSKPLQARQIRPKHPFSAGCQHVLRYEVHFVPIKSDGSDRTGSNRIEPNGTE